MTLPIRLHLRMSAWEVKTDNRMTAKNVLSFLVRQPPRTSLTLDSSDRATALFVAASAIAYARGHLSAHTA